MSEESIVEDYYSYYLETTNVSKLVKEIENNNSSDAFILACFEDSGIDSVRKITSKPVIGIGEAAFYTANIIANKFSIITNLSVSHEAIKNNLIKYDLDHKCVSLRSIEVPILDMETMSKSNIKKLEYEINRTIVEDNPEAIIITSPGILNLTKIFSDRFTGFVSRMWLDHCDETKDYLSVTEDYPTYLINNFKYLVRRFNTENGNEEWNVK